MTLMVNFYKNLLIKTELGVLQFLIKMKKKIQKNKKLNCKNLINLISSN